MKTVKLKRIVALLLACMMLSGLAITVRAGSCDPCDGETVYQRTECYNSFSGGYHPYTKADGSTGTCELIVYQYRDVMKCSTCGDVSYENYNTVTKHSVCGQN